MFAALELALEEGVEVEFLVADAIDRVVVERPADDGRLTEDEVGFEIIGKWETDA